MKLSERVQRLTASPTLEVKMQAERLRSEGVDVIDFGPGEPDFATPAHIREAAKRFGSQCIVISVDVKRHENGNYEVYSHSGKHPTGLDLVTWTRRIEDAGAGEIFLNSIDRDGSAQGYDVKLIKQV